MSGSVTYTILIVDDDESIRFLFQEVLTRAGYYVTTVQDASAALTQLESTNFHLLLTDFTMPNTTGVELIKCVRIRYPLLRTLLMSAHPLLPQLAQEAGADGFFVKGNSITDLISCVEAALA